MNQKIKIDDQLITSLHRSVQQIINLFKLVKANPPELRAKSVVEYAQLIEQMLTDFYNVVPKMCVPMHLFRTMERQTSQVSQLAQNYMKEHRKSLIELKVMEDKLKQTQAREKVLIQEKKLLIANNQHYKKKAQQIKKSGEQSVKKLLQVGSQRQARAHRHSLPHLDKKQKLTLLYLMGPTNNNERLVHHLLSKR